MSKSSSVELTADRIEQIYSLAQKEDLASWKPWQNSGFAREFISHAKALASDASSNLDFSQARTKDRLLELQELRLAIWKEEMGEFVELFDKIKNVELVGKLENCSDTYIPDVKEEIKAIQEYSISAGGTLKVAGSAVSLAAGGIAGVVAWNGAMALGTASTGATIAGLTGAAATNATLAWFGGGSLVAGGGGMAAGAVVLGIIGFVPVVAVASGVSLIMSRWKLSKARVAFINAYEFADQCKTAVAVIDGIDEITSQMLDYTQQLRSRMKANLEQLGHMIAYCGADYREFCRKSQERTLESILYAETMKHLVFIPVMMEDGARNENTPEALKPVQQLLAENNE